MTSTSTIRRGVLSLVAILAFLSACTKPSTTNESGQAQCTLSPEALNLLEKRAGEGGASSEVLAEFAEELHHLKEVLKSHDSEKGEASLKQTLHEIQIRLMQISEQLKANGSSLSGQGKPNEAYIKRMAFTALKHEEGDQIMPFLGQIQIHPNSEQKVEVEIPFKNRGEPETTYVGWVACQTQPEVRCTVDRVEL